MPKTISEDNMVTVFRAVVSKPRELAMLLLLLDTGITLSELEEINDNDVDLSNRSARVYRQKTRKERYIYFSTQTAAAIDAYRFVRPQPLVQPRLLLTRDGYPITGKRIQKILETVGCQSK